MGSRSFFVEPGSIQGDRAVLRGQVAHQLSHVLRLTEGDVIELLDNSGTLHLARILECAREEVVARVEERREPAAEPRTRLILYQALLKGDKMETVLQKGTEIGCTRFVPVLGERSVSRPGAGELERKLPRWRTIIREAAEQCGRATLPEVGPLASLEEACRQAAEAELSFMAWEEEEMSSGLGRLVREARQSREVRGEAGPIAVSVLVGPEGGFSAREAGIARSAGVRLASLGPRILRAETAAVVAATVVMDALGEMGG